MGQRAREKINTGGDSQLVYVSHSIALLLSVRLNSANAHLRAEGRSTLGKGSIFPSRVNLRFHRQGNWPTAMRPHTHYHLPPLPNCVSVANCAHPYTMIHSNIFHYLDCVHHENCTNSIVLILEIYEYTGIGVNEVKQYFRFAAKE